MGILSFFPALFSRLLWLILFILMRFTKSGALYFIVSTLLTLKMWDLSYPGFLSIFAYIDREFESLCGGLGFKEFYLLPQLYSVYFIILLSFVKVISLIFRFFWVSTTHSFRLIRFLICLFILLSSTLSESEYFHPSFKRNGKDSESGFLSCYNKMVYFELSEEFLFLREFINKKLHGEDWDKYTCNYFCEQYCQKTKNFLLFKKKEKNGVNLNGWGNQNPAEFFKIKKMKIGSFSVSLINKGDSTKVVISSDFRGRESFIVNNDEASVSKLMSFIYFLKDNPESGVYSSFPEEYNYKKDHHGNTKTCLLGHFLTLEAIFNLINDECTALCQIEIPDLPCVSLGRLDSIYLSNILGIRKVYSEILSDYSDRFFNSCDNGLITPLLTKKCRLFKPKNVKNSEYKLFCSDLNRLISRILSRSGERSNSSYIRMCDVMKPSKLCLEFLDLIDQESQTFFSNGKDKSVLRSIKNSPLKGQKVSLDLNKGKGRESLDDDFLQLCGKYREELVESVNLILKFHHGKIPDRESIIQTVNELREDLEKMNELYKINEERMNKPRRWTSAKKRNEEMIERNEQASLKSRMSMLEGRIKSIVIPEPTEKEEIIYKGCKGVILFRLFFREIGKRRIDINEFEEKFLKEKSIIKEITDKKDLEMSDACKLIIAKMGGNSVKLTAEEKELRRRTSYLNFLKTVKFSGRDEDNKDRGQKTINENSDDSRDINHELKKVSDGIKSILDEGISNDFLVSYSRALIERIKLRRSRKVLNIISKNPLKEIVKCIFKSRGYDPNIKIGASIKKEWTLDFNDGKCTDSLMRLRKSYLIKDIDGIPLFLYEN